MAHECPDCGYVCHCADHIDSRILDENTDVDYCVHCSEIVDPDDGLPMEDDEE